MHIRKRLKWLHWMTAGLMIYFMLVEPEDVEKLGAMALTTHAGLGTLLAIVVFSWFAGFLRHGLISKPGPKLPSLFRRTHAIGYRMMYWLALITILSGALTGFAAPFAIRAFDLVTVFPGWGSKGLHELVAEIHELVFDVTTIAIVIHALFHIWRHYWLRDNALRIMAPKILYRYL